MSAISRVLPTLILILLLTVAKSSRGQQPASPTSADAAAKSVKIKGFYIGMPFDEAVTIANELASKSGGDTKVVIIKDEGDIYVGKTGTIFGSVVEAGPMSHFVHVRANPENHQVDYLWYTKNAFNAEDLSTEVFVANLTQAYQLPPLTRKIRENYLTKEIETVYEGFSDLGFKVNVDNIGVGIRAITSKKQRAFD